MLCPDTRGVLPVALARTARPLQRIMDDGLLLYIVTGGKPAEAEVV